jgi:hypothetical protein
MVYEPLYMDEKGDLRISFSLPVRGAQIGAKKIRGQRKSGCIFYYAETIPSNISPLYPEKEGRRLYMIRMPFLLVLRGQLMKRWSAVRSTTVYTPKSNRRHRVVVAIIHRSKIFPGKVGYVLQYALPVTPRGVSPSTREASGTGTTDASILVLDLYSHPSFRRMIVDAFALIRSR